MEITIGCELLFPVVTVPKFTLEGLAAIFACVPIPLRATVVVGSEPLLVAAIEMLPVMLLIVVGANCAVKLALFPASKVKGRVMPLTLKPVPVALMAVTFSLAVPEFVTVTTCFPELPTAMPPNETGLGFTDNEAEPAAAPCPASEIDIGELGALLTREIEPATLDVAVGLKTALNVTDPPAWIVSGAASPVVLKAVPVTAN